MVASRVRFSFAVALVAAVAVLFLALAAPAAAAGTGTVDIHSRICPTSPPQVTNLFNQCHHRPGPDGASYRLDGRSPRAISARSGNVRFGSVAAGNHTVALTSAFQPNEFLRMRVFCSTDGGTAVELPIRFGDQASFRVWVGSGAKVVCDVYFLPISGRG